MSDNEEHGVSADENRETSSEDQAMESTNDAGPANDNAEATDADQAQDSCESSDAQDAAKDCPAADPAGIKRRGILAGILGGLVGAIPAVIASIFFLDPLIKKWFPKQPGEAAVSSGVVKDAEGRIRLDVTLEALPQDGTPQSYTVFDDIVNVWNKFPNQPVGTIWLRRMQGATPPVLAFSSICPHLGCAVEHRKGENDFFCPCHTSSFELNGSKKNDIPPRAMDKLEVTITDGNILWLDYKEYRGATSEQVEVS